jgi:hypothetical protein
MPNKWSPLRSYLSVIAPDTREAFVFVCGTSRALFRG